MDDFWQRFRLDPRDPANGPMRASDADRELVRTVLGDAYADGRLSHDDHDERLTATLTAVTLADLLPIVSDLVPATPTRAVARLTDSAIEQQAAAKFRSDVRDGVGGLLFIALLTNVIWFLTGHDYFYWPVFPTLAVGVKALDTVLHREQIVAKEHARLERRRTKELEQRKRVDPEQDDE